MNREAFLTEGDTLMPGPGRQDWGDLDRPAPTWFERFLDWLLLPPVPDQGEDDES